MSGFFNFIAIDKTNLKEQQFCEAIQFAYEKQFNSLMSQGQTIYSANYAAMQHVNMYEYNARCTQKLKPPTEWPKDNTN